MHIERIDAYSILDSRGNPTVEAEVTLKGGAIGRGLAPSGASTGQFEALELRDGNPRRYRGKSVDKAIDHIRSQIAPLLGGRDANDQESIDRAMIDADGTPDKSRLGANAILAVSMAVANAAANARAVPLFEHLGQGAGRLLPLPEIQIIGGGAHAHWRTDVQDYLVIATGASNYQQALEMTYNVYHAAGDLLGAQGRRHGAADEGGYWPDFESNEEPLALLTEAIGKAGFVPGADVAIALDIAASDLYDEPTARYRLKLDKRDYSADAFSDMLAHWCTEYPIVSIEDPFADTDFSAWRAFRERLGSRLQIVGDDLFTTHRERIARGIDEGLANAVLIKLNQIGTVSETLAAIRQTQQAGWRPIVSARSGETEDAFICHLAVAANAGQIKVGSITRGERTAKWNELVRIERRLGAAAQFPASTTLLA